MSEQEPEAEDIDRVAEHWAIDDLLDQYNLGKLTLEQVASEFQQHLKDAI